MSKAIIALHQVHKYYLKGVHALQDVNLSIEEGQWTAMMGPSGSGKTTLLNLLDGLDRPSLGRIEILGIDTSRFSADNWTVFRRENIGLVFQQFYLIPYLTALENVMLAQYYHSMADKRQAQKSLEEIGLGARMHHFPSELSGGEQQRVCIARALINEPKIILADEPTGNLDEDNEKIVMDIFHKLDAERKTVLMVTHNPNLGRLADRRIYLEHGRVKHEHWV
ncbi:MAG: ABC transporter ATP-binding protein [Candidatus Omnitrophica bacterium]|nr:ABC transporter ATP-binding protein [Candidatus Omnitrophota bacterium]